MKAPATPNFAIVAILDISLLLLIYEPDRGSSGSGKVCLPLFAEGGNAFLVILAFAKLLDHFTDRAVERGGILYNPRHEPPGMCLRCRDAPAEHHHVNGAREPGDA